MSVGRRAALRRRYLTATAVSLIICLLLLIPYWLAYSSAGEELVFTDSLMNPEDSQTYFAKMGAGYRGEWLYTVPFTPEPHEGFFVGFLYIALGHGARVSGLSLPAVWHGARFVSGVVMFLAIFAFTGLFFDRPRGRWTAFLLAAVGSGFGWVLSCWGPLPGGRFTDGEVAVMVLGCYGERCGYICLLGGAVDVWYCKAGWQADGKFKGRDRYEKREQRGSSFLIGNHSRL